MKAIKATVILTAAVLLAGIQPVPAHDTVSITDSWNRTVANDLPTYPVLVPKTWLTSRPRWSVNPAPAELPEGWDAAPPIIPAGPASLALGVARSSTTWWRFDPANPRR